MLPCLAFALYVSLEVTIGQWAFTSLTEEHGIGTFAASTWVAVYWVALTAGRLWLGLAGHQVSVRRLLGLAMVGAAVGAVILWAVARPPPSGCSPPASPSRWSSPCSCCGRRSESAPRRAASAVGWQTSAAAIGAAAGPALAGIVLGRVGIEAYGPVVLAMALALAVAILAVEAGSHASAPSGGRRCAGRVAGGITPEPSSRRSDRRPASGRLSACWSASWSWSRSSGRSA